MDGLFHLIREDMHSECDGYDAMSPQQYFYEDMHSHLNRVLMHAVH